MQPCGRCCRLNLDCIPQTRGPTGRPLKLHKTRTQLAVERALGETKPSTGNPPGPSSATINVKQEQEQDDDSSRSATTSKASVKSKRGGANGKRSSPEMLVIKLPFRGNDMMHIQRSAQSVCVSFPKLKAEGRVMEERTLGMLRIWAVYSYKVRADATLGVYDALAHTISPSVQLAVPVGPSLPNAHHLDPHGEPLDLVDPTRITQHNHPLPLYLKLVRGTHIRFGSTWRRGDVGWSDCGHLIVVVVGRRVATYHHEPLIQFTVG